MIISHINKLRRRVRYHNFAKGCWGSCINEAISCKQKGWVGWISITYSKRRSSWNVSCGLYIAVPSLIVSNSNVWICSMIKQINHGNNAQVTRSIICFEASSVGNLEGPFCQIVILLGFITEKWHHDESRIKRNIIGLILPGQRSHQRW